MSPDRQWGRAFDAAWSRMTRVIAFFCGTAIMVYETVADTQDRPWLYAAALGLMGLPVARAAESVLSKLGPPGPGSEDDPTGRGPPAREEQP